MKESMSGSKFQSTFGQTSTNSSGHQNSNRIQTNNSSRQSDDHNQTQKQQTSSDQTTYFNLSLDAKGVFQIQDEQQFPQREYMKQKQGMIIGHNFHHTSRGSYGASNQQLMQFEEEGFPSLFFESPSKYIGLKKFRSLQNPSSTSVSNDKEKKKVQQANKVQQVKESMFDKQPDKGLSISKWFEGLSLPDKSIILTIVDKQLVGLLISMYKCYREHGNGKFNNYCYPKTHEINEYKSVRDYNLHFKLPIHKGPGQFSSQTLKEVYQAEDTVVNSVRVFSVNEENDAFTLDIEQYRSAHYFMEIIKKCQQDRFLKQELQYLYTQCFNNYNRFSDSLQRMEKSVFNVGNNEPKQHYTYFSPSIDMKLGESKNSGLTLAEVIIFLLEKAINIQFQDYKGSIQTKQMQFYFTEPKIPHLYFDQKLTGYWLSLSHEKKNNFFQQINNIEDQILMDEHKKQVQNQIQEEEKQIDEDKYSYDSDNHIPGMSSNNNIDNDDEEDNLQDQEFEFDKMEQEKYSIDSVDLEEQKPKRSIKSSSNSSYFMNYDIKKQNQSSYGYGNWPNFPYIHKSDQFRQNNSNQLCASKMRIISAGREINTEEQAFCFIKKISLHQSFDNIIHKSLNSLLLSKFYALVYDQYDKAILEDLLDMDVKSQKSNNSKLTASQLQNCQNKLQQLNISNSQASNSNLLNVSISQQSSVLYNASQSQYSFSNNDSSNLASQRKKNKKKKKNKSQKNKEFQENSSIIEQKSVVTNEVIQERQNNYREEEELLNTISNIKYQHNMTKIDEDDGDGLHELQKLKEQQRIQQVHDQQQQEIITYQDHFGIVGDNRNIHSSIARNIYLREDNDIGCISGIAKEMDERRSLLTGEIQSYKYKDINEQIQKNDESEQKQNQQQQFQQQLQPGQEQEKKKKKKNKNKNKKKKKKKDQISNIAQSNPENTIPNNIIIQPKINETLLHSQREETLNIEQIELIIPPNYNIESPSSQQSPFPVLEKSQFMSLSPPQNYNNQKERKVNNFFNSEPLILSNNNNVQNSINSFQNEEQIESNMNILTTNTVVEYQQEIQIKQREDLEEEDEQEQEETKKITQVIASELLQQVIYSIEDKNQVISGGSNNNNNASKKKKNNKKVEEKVKKRKNPKKNKNKNISQKQQYQQQQQQQDSLQEKKSIIVHERVETQNITFHKELSSSVDNKHLVQKQTQLLHSSINSGNKKVGFQVFVSKNNKEDEEEVKVPKRGSSKGSSGEEVVHQNTLSNLVDLFPQEYKIPSDSTKTIISELTQISQSSLISNDINQSNSQNIQHNQNTSRSHTHQNFNTKPLVQQQQQQKSNQQQQQSNQNNDKSQVDIMQNTNKDNKINMQQQYNSDIMLQQYPQVSKNNTNTTYQKRKPNANQKKKPLEMQTEEDLDLLSTQTMNSINNFSSPQHKNQVTKNNEKYKKKEENKEKDHIHNNNNNNNKAHNKQNKKNQQLNNEKKQLQYDNYQSMFKNEFEQQQDKSQIQTQQQQQQQQQQQIQPVQNNVIPINKEETNATALSKKNKNQSQNQQKQKNKPTQEIENTQEKGQFVNPDLIKAASKKGKKQKNKIIVDNKQDVPQQKQQQQQTLIIEHRSQTPIIEINSNLEPLTTGHITNTNNHNKNSFNKKTYNKNNHNQSFMKSEFSKQNSSNNIPTNINLSDTNANSKYINQSQYHSQQQQQQIQFQQYQSQQNSNSSGSRMNQQQYQQNNSKFKKQKLFIQQSSFNQQQHQQQQLLPQQPITQQQQQLHQQQFNKLLQFDYQNQFHQQQLPIHNVPANQFLMPMQVQLLPNNSYCFIPQSPAQHLFQLNQQLQTQIPQIQVPTQIQQYQQQINDQQKQQESIKQANQGIQEERQINNSNDHHLNQTPSQIINMQNILLNNLQQNLNLHQMGMNLSQQQQQQQIQQISSNINPDPQQQQQNQHQSQQQILVNNQLTPQQQQQQQNTYPPNQIYMVPYQLQQFNNLQIAQQQIQNSIQLINQPYQPLNYQFINYQNISQNMFGYINPQQQLSAMPNQQQQIPFQQQNNQVLSNLNNLSSQNEIINEQQQQINQLQQSFNQLKNNTNQQQQQQQNFYNQNNNFKNESENESLRLLTQLITNKINNVQQQQYNSPSNLLQNLIPNSNPNFIPNVNNFPQPSMLFQTTEQQLLQQQQQQLKEEDFFTQLEQEIITLQDNLKFKLKQCEFEREQAFQLLVDMIKNTYQNQIDKELIQVQMYGSMATGLAIDSSDMDILVSGIFLAQTTAKESYIERSKLIVEMQKLHLSLNSLTCLASNSLIDTASVPVIKIKLDLMKIRSEYSQNEDIIDEQMQFLKIDITFNDQETQQQNEKVNKMNSIQQQLPVHLGIKCCELIKEMMIDYPFLEPLTIVFKKFLAIKDLNSPFLGGLSSYGLILLLISLMNGNFSWHFSPVTLQPSLGRTFYHFLLYFGKLFDPSSLMISADLFIETINNGQNSQYLMGGGGGALTIIDPLNINNNIGKSTYNFEQIKIEISMAYDRMSLMIQNYNMDNDESNRKDNLQILLNVLQIPQLEILNNFSIKNSQTSSQNNNNTNNEYNNYDETGVSIDTNINNINNNLISNKFVKNVSKFN